MLVEFSVENFRSIAKNQTLKMTASGGSSQDERFFETNNTIVPYVYATSCILGPNATGKTNFIDAIVFFCDFVRFSSTKLTFGNKIPIEPNLLIDNFREKPSVFEIVFVVNGSVYQYGFSVFQDKVFEEWMYWRSNASNSRMKKIFSRRFDSDKSKYHWEFNDKKLYGERKVWINHTRSNALFLSTTVQLNSDVLAEPAGWISNELKCICRLSDLNNDFTINELSKNKSKIVNLLNSFDLKIGDINVKKIIEKKRKNENYKLDREHSVGFVEKFQNASRAEVEFLHESTNSQLVPINLREESAGTNSLFSLAGPLLDVLENGFTLIIDEIQNSLHPLAQKFLVGLFQCDKTNKKGAQLVITTHASSIIAYDFLVQEQIWLFEWDNNIGSKLVPLEKFKLDGNEDYQAFYLHGMFGAIPKLENLDQI